MLRRLAALLSVLLICVGCAAQPTVSPDGISYTDASGGTALLPRQPKNVAVLFSSLADIWVTAGGTVAITVGESVERGFADETAVLVDDGAGKVIDTERLISAAPDLVIGSADVPAQCDAIGLCRSVGIPAVLLQVESFEQYLAALKVFTQLTEQPERYTRYGEELQATIETDIRQFTDAHKPQRVLFIRAGSSAGATKAKSTSQHFVCGMLAELGAVNIADRAPVLLDGLSLEEVLAQDPDRILITTMGNEQAAREYMQSVLTQPAWQRLTAVKEARVTYLPKDLFQYKPNARWGEAYRCLIAVLEGRDAV